MSKKSEKPTMSKEELNRLISMAEPYAATGNDTELTSQTDDGKKKTTPEPTVDNISEMATIENVASISTKPTEDIVSTIPSRTIAPTTPELPSVDTSLMQSTQPTQQRISSRQRKASLDEYREMFMTAPKIIDRQPVFVSRQTRDSIDNIVRRLGERKMSVSGFLENLARHHLELYADDLEQWKRL